MIARPGWSNLFWLLRPVPVVASGGGGGGDDDDDDDGCGQGSDLSGSTFL